MKRKVLSTVTENDRKYICKRGNLFEDIYFAREFMIMMNGMKWMYSVCKITKMFKNEPQWREDFLVRPLLNLRLSRIKIRKKMRYIEGKIGYGMIQVYFGWRHICASCWGVDSSHVNQWSSKPKNFIRGHVGFVHVHYYADYIHIICPRFSMLHILTMIYFKDEKRLVLDSFIGGKVCYY